MIWLVIIGCIVLYLLIGGIIGNVVFEDDEVCVISCIFFWPFAVVLFIFIYLIINPINVVAKFLIKTIKNFLMLLAVLSGLNKKRRNNG